MWKRKNLFNLTWNSRFTTLCLSNPWFNVYFSQRWRFKSRGKESSHLSEFSTFLIKSNSIFYICFILVDLLQDENHTFNLLFGSCWHKLSVYWDGEQNLLNFTCVNMNLFPVPMFQTKESKIETFAHLRCYELLISEHEEWEKNGKWWNWYHWTTWIILKISI